jgi:hypothetical protein
MLARFFNLTNAALLVALSLSTVAAWYSIIGLTAIFAGAVIPIIIMGGFLELAKITTTVWLRKYWHRCSLALKLYMVPAIVLLMILTSMGIFGFLSKAHSDQGMVSGDVQAKLAIYDEKIKIEKDNIDANRKALKQMDEAVDQVMGRSTDEKGADKAVAIRRGQQVERGRLLKEIGESQKKITALNEERAPIAAENRKVEAEVGPIKYIAALIYGDNPDANLLERAVRWVIILLVIVFDPLAIALVLAANQSREWDKEKPNEEISTPVTPTEEVTEEVAEEVTEEEKPWHERYPYLAKPFSHFTKTTPMVYKPETLPPVEETSEDEAFKELEDNIARKLNTIRLLNKEPEVVSVEKPVEKTETEIETEGITKAYRNTEGPYVEVEGRHMHENVAMQLHPKLELSPETEGGKNTVKFGNSFPEYSQSGDIYTRIDVLPHKVYKFNGKKWIPVDKSITDVYLSTTYIEFLVGKISSGEYDPELLTPTEQDEIAELIQKQNG